MSLIIGIHPDIISDGSYAEKWATFLKKHSVMVKKLDLLAIDALEQAKTCHGIMWRWAHNPQDKQSAKNILFTIEHYLKKPVYPDFETAWHYDEKVAQFYLLDALQAPVPKTWIFWDYKRAVEWSRSAPYPIIFKLSVGAGSSNVLKISKKDEMLYLLRRMFKTGVFPMTMNEYKRRSSLTFNGIKSMAMRSKESFNYVVNFEYPRLDSVWWKPEFGYAYFQEFLQENEFDTRITVIGNRAFGFRRFNRPNDFRASGSGLIDYNYTKIDLRCVKIAFEISKHGKFQSMAYDFLYKNGTPLICEISYTFSDWAVHKCPGYWDSGLKWIESQTWPEEAQAEDFIKQINSINI